MNQMIFQIYFSEILITRGNSIFSGWKILLLPIGVNEIFMIMKLLQFSVSIPLYFQGFETKRFRCWVPPRHQISGMFSKLLFYISGSWNLAGMLRTTQISYVWRELQDVPRLCLSLVLFFFCFEDSTGNPTLLLPRTALPREKCY